jgi:fructokinase
MTKNSSSILCFGEMLWDIFPDGAVPGGAPLNVALGLKKLGREVFFLSAAGNDQYGYDLVKYLVVNGIQTDFIQRNNYPTGIVQVTLSQENDATYDIVFPSAWDFISHPETLPEHEILVYGSLACRNSNSFETLCNLLRPGALKIFDVNLRPPYTDRNTIEYLLHHSDIVKMNIDELHHIGSWHGASSDTEALMEVVMQQYGVGMVCVTCGKDGAFLKSGSEMLRQKGFMVKTVDTVGSGDAFLAGFIHGYSGGLPTEKALEFACRMGAYVASHQGANPPFSENALEALQETE